MKTGLINQRAVPRPVHNPAGMTLIEVLVALAITGLTVGGIVTGYIFCTDSTVKDTLYMEANARAMERLEQTQSARWDTSSNPAVDQLVSSNFPDATVVLDKAASGSNIISATLKTDITQISFNPPIKRIHVDCIWLFKGVVPVTNSIETCRAPN